MRMSLTCEACGCALKVDKETGEVFCDCAELEPWQRQALKLQTEKARQKARKG